MIPVSLILRIAPYVLCLLIGAGSAWKVTANHYQVIIAEKDAAAALAIREAQASVIIAQKTQQEITTKVTTAYENKLLEIRSRYAAYDFGITDGVRQLPSTGSGLRSIPNASGRSDGAAACSRLSKELRIVAEEQAYELLYLQDWILKQKAATE